MLGLKLIHDSEKGSQDNYWLICNDHVRVMYVHNRYFKIKLIVYKLISSVTPAILDPTP